VRFGAGEDEQPRGVDGPGVAGARVAQDETLQVFSALGRADLGLDVEGDVFDAADLLHEVLRHRAQVVAAHEDVYLPGVPGEIDGRLARGVRPTHDVHLVPGAARRLRGRRPVEDAAALQLAEPRRGQQPVRDAGGQHHRVGRDRRAVAESHQPGRPAGLQADDLACAQQLGAEPQRLPAGPLGQLGARHPVREAQVVLDPAALAGLPAGRTPLDEHRAQPLGGAVHRCAETGRSGADDDEVIEVGRRHRGEPDVRRQVRLRGRDERLAIARDHQRDVGRGAARGGQ
jgi:hypothetical protein